MKLQAGDDTTCEDQFEVTSGLQSKNGKDFFAKAMLTLYDYSRITKAALQTSVYTDFWKAN